MDEQRKLGKCAYIQNEEYNEQNNPNRYKTEWKRQIKYSNTKMLTNLINIKQDKSKKS